MIESAVNHKIKLDLRDPAMTWLHLAGMAGLWMTLRQLEQLYPTSTERLSNLTWSLTPHSISLDWQGQDLIVLDWLLKQSFQIGDEGLISLMGLNSQTMDVQTQITIHLGITGTFLQHNQFFKSAGDASKRFIIDGRKIIVEYKKAASYAHQHFAQNLCDQQGQLLQEPIGIVGWLYPGAVVRHYAFKKHTQFEENPARAFALLFAPVACQYFILRSRLEPQQSQYVLVVPEITDLELYARRCWSLKDLGYKNFHASSLGDAGLRFLTSEKTIAIAKHTRVERCQVISFGKATWSKQQKTRTQITVVEAEQTVSCSYEFICDRFPETRLFKYENKYFVIPSLAREIVADSLLRNLPWWANFSTKINSSELFKQISLEKDGLHQMIQDTEWDDNAQKLFVKACHEALRITYAKIYSRTKDGKYAQIERKNEQLRAELGCCKNAAAFRQFITIFWSRAGQNSILQEYWEELLSLTTGRIDWQIARDLTLLAFASYKPTKMSLTDSSKDEDKNTEANSTDL